MIVADSWVETLKQEPFRYNKMSNVNKAAELRPRGQVARFKESTGKRKEGICVTERPEWLGQLMLEPAHLNFISSQMEASSDADVFLGKVIQTLSGDPMEAEMVFRGCGGTIVERVSSIS